MGTVIRLENLSKIYGRGKNTVAAVNNLSLEVEAGQIYGFLGPNGAGKTSTIRMLLKLIYPTSGNIYLFDTPSQDAIPILQTRVGALVEEASFYPFMSGYENLRTLAQISGHNDKKRVDYTLAQVGMTAFADRKTKTYSTGMKQRLGVAAALLNNPDLLILDEPTNGLDPKGIQDMRDMFQHLAKNEGKTIFLSSHLLHEIEQTCDHVAIINNGALIREGAVSNLLATESIIQIKASPLQNALNAILEKFPSKIVGEYLEITAKHEVIPQIIQTLVANEIAIYEVTPKRRTLADLFLEVTND